MQKSVLFKQKFKSERNHDYTFCCRIQKRKEKREQYIRGLETVKGIEILSESNESESNNAYFPIVIKEDYRLTRNALYERLKRNNIFARKYFYPLASDEACFKNKYRDVSLDNARYLSDRVLVLPMYEELDEGDIDRIIGIIGD